MASQYDQQLNSLNEQAQNIQDRLSSSPTAYGGEATPTYSDISLQTKYQNLKTKISGLEKKAMQEKWYGPTQEPAAAAEGAKPEGFVAKSIDFLNRPLYGIEGAVAHVVGKGSAPTIWGDAAENITKGKKTFGDLLKSSGVPYPVAAPLGLALDIGSDPFNWATAGTSALIPRLATGLAKGVAKEGIPGAVKGVGLAAKSNLLSKAITTEKYIPLPFQNTEKYKNVLAKMKQTSATTGEEYNKFIDKDINQLIGKYGLPATAGVKKYAGIAEDSPYRASLGDMVQILSKVTPATEKLFDTLNYSNKDWMRLARIKDELQQSLGLYGETFNNAMKAYKEGKPIDEYIAQAKKQIEEVPAATPAQMENVSINWDQPAIPLPREQVDQAVSKLSAENSALVKPEVADSLANGIEDATTVMYNPSISYSMDPVENAMRVASEAVGSPVTFDDIKKIVESGAVDATGIKWYDDMIKSVKDLKYTAKTKNGDKVYEVGKNVIEGLEKHLGVFKIVKVAASPSAWTNSILGNVLFAKMIGVNVFSKEFFNEIKNAYKMTTGSKDSDIIINEFMNIDEVARAIKEAGTAFNRTTGLSEKYLSSKYLVAKVLRNAADNGMDVSKIDKDQAVQDIIEEINTLKQAVATSPDVMQAGAMVSKLVEEVKKVPVENRVEWYKQALKKGGMSVYDMPTSFAPNELLSSTVTNRMLNTIRENAEKPGATWVQKALNFTLNKTVNAYDRIDQAYRIATVSYLTRQGISEGELNIMRRFVNFSPEDIVKHADVDGIRRYYLSGTKALEVANEAYINYAAMPAAIRMLRQIPLISAPFASFMYGMLLKTANTAVHNPAFFNKVSFAMNDFGGEKTPLEKKTLEDPQHQYLKSPGMYRVPFLNENPLYINAAGMLPYLSFNMFNPSERNYADLYPDKLVNIIDHTPFITSNPAGSAIFDYLIQPMILQDSIPVGAFNQPIYPYGAGIGTKALYAGRQLAESVTPGFVSPLGLAVPSDYAELLPSYGMRKFSEAKEGKNPLGIPTKEEALSRTVRAGLGFAGVPVQAPVQTWAAEQQVQQPNQ